MFKCSRALLKNLWKKLSESILYRIYSDIKFSMVSFKIARVGRFSQRLPYFVNSPSYKSKDSNASNTLRANARNVSFKTLYGGQFTNSVDNTKLPCYPLPPTQHHSLFRNLPPLYFTSLIMIKKHLLRK